VLQAAADLGYRPNVIAQGLKAGQSRMLGYSWTPVPPDQYNPILDKFLQSMAEAATEHNYHVLAFPAPSMTSEIEAYREMGATGRVDGFVLSATILDDPRVRYLIDAGFPFVAFGRSSPEWDFAYVDVDGGVGVRQAVEHLLALGHERIACLAWPEASLTGQHRVRGYCDGMAAGGLEAEAGWLLRIENDYAQAYAAARQLLALPPRHRPTAVVCVSDLVAIGALNAATDVGMRVGHEFAVVGFDDSPMVQFLSPPLTSIRQPVAEVGKRIVEILLAEVRREPLARRQEVLAPRLIVRASTLPS
jgi:DNA-binding LacI/PurR family transcriptional regulator